VTASAERWAAYTDAILHMKAPEGLIRVLPAPLTWTAGVFPDADGRHIYVITAHNPGGRLSDDAANAAAQEKLEAELGQQNLTWWPAAGGDPSWTHVEPSVAVLGFDQREATALGAAYGQEAIFALTPAERQVIHCRTGWVTSTGWSIQAL
jgi:hypothetical protein